MARQENQEAIQVVNGSAVAPSMAMPGISNSFEFSVTKLQFAGLPSVVTFRNEISRDGGMNWEGGGEFTARLGGAQADPQNRGATSCGFYCDSSRWVNKTGFLQRTVIQATTNGSPSNRRVDLLAIFDDAKRKSAQNISIAKAGLDGSR